MLRFLGLILLACAALADEAHPTLKIGSPAPDFSLPGVDGHTHTLADYASSRVLAIVFMSNHCPVAQLYEARIKRLVDDYQSKGLALIGVNPNNPAGLQLDEMRFSDIGDTLEEDKIRAEFSHFNFPYLDDGETQSMAQAYGPATTPHIFIFDQQRKLRYEGRIDDNRRERLVKVQDARNAIEALLAGKAVVVPHTASFGCTIKWKAKAGLRLTEQERMDSEPVELAAKFSTPDDIAKLRGNANTGQLLLVTFWSESSPPSMEQLAKIVTIYRMYRRRDLAVVTVAVNPTDDMQAPLSVLKKAHASMQNIQIASGRRFSSEAAFDSKWDGSLPYAAVIGTDGTLLYKQEGKGDDLQLRRLLLANLPAIFSGEYDPDRTRDYWLGK
jgi:thiol-disulfide isomerase/thioredoxin